MILKALYDYYNRCDNLAPEGMEYKEISFLIVIDKEGKFVRLEDRRIDNKNSSKFLVLKGVGRSSNPVANILWDNCSYVLGITEANLPLNNPSIDSLKLEKKEAERKKEVAKNVKNHNVFTKKVDELMEKLPNNKDIAAIKAFYATESTNIDSLKLDPKWDDLKKNLIKNISFIIDGETQIIAAKETITKHLLQNETNQNACNDICLVTGVRGSSVETTTATPITGSQAVAKLVAFQVDSGYDSYGKEKCHNAPISKKAEFAYATALNRLLAKDSHNKFCIGSRTFLFWASSNNDVSHEAENSLYDMFGTTSNDDDPNRKIASAREVFNDIYSGKKPTSDDDRFYFLGLAPNVARIAVVYWNECPLREFSGLILRHFDDMKIIDTRKEGKKKPYQGLYQMMSAITLGGKHSDVQPNLPEATIKSIMQGTQYPASLYQACIRRIRAEQDVIPYGSPCRAAIIKAYLNRLSNNKTIKSMLDKESTNQGYLCGRLFATLEKIQEDANHIHSIRNHYMNAASTTPSTVFATIMNLSVHHAEKLKMGKQIFFEKLKQEIIEKLPANGFPAHLNLQDQGRFFVGYYQQRQDFFVSKEAKEAGINEELENQ